MDMVKRGAPRDSVGDTAPALRGGTSWLVRFLGGPRLQVWIVALGVGLTLPSLFIGFQLDDHIGRFIYSDLPGADRLYRIYAGGYGIANGDPVDAAWMMEEGYAPWWMNPHLLLAMWRPVSLGTHLLDANLFPENAVLWHAHSLLWFALLLFAATLTYRSVQGSVVGGLAALLFAVDHTHGLPVSFIANRYIIIGTTFALLALHEHHRRRSRGIRIAGWSAAACYALSLFASESSVAIAFYLFGYALFVDAGGRRERALSVVPYLAITIAWRVGYSALGYGARGSGLYIDPAHEPLQFMQAVIERFPILLLGQWFIPGAEVHAYVEEQTAFWLGIWAWVFAILFVLAVWPLLKRDKLARFWATGMVPAIALVCAGDPANRLLFVSGIGAMGLLAQWWSSFADDLQAAARSWLEKLERSFARVMLVFHLLISALWLPLFALSLLLFTPLYRALADVGPEAAGREAVFVTVPDYYVVRLARMTKEVDGEPTPSRWRALAYGPERVTVSRPDARTLILDYKGGAMSSPAMQLYRKPDAPMSKGQVVRLEGLSIEVLDVTRDGRPLRARFEFAESLDSPRYRFYHWADNRLRPFVMPQVGARRVLPPAILVPAL
jgi:hypothetical protein